MKFRLKEYRARFDMTQEQLAEKVGCSRQYIIALEKGQTDGNVSSKLLLKIAQVFGCKIDDLFFCEDSSLE